MPAGLTPEDWSALRAAYEASRHAARRVDGGYRSRNPRQAWTTRFDGRGFTVRPDSGDWTWGLDLLRYGFEGDERRVTRPTAASAEGPRVVYAWGGGLDEWYVNAGRGLEHGYTVHQRPPRAETGSENRAGDESLIFTLAVRGSLVPEVLDGGRDVRFVDGDGTAVLTYTGLTVFDAGGQPLPARFEPVPAGLRLIVDERTARYPLTIDPIAQQAYLKASNAEAFDRLGIPVAVSGDTVVVGAYAEDSSAVGVNGDQTDNGAEDSGAAYVFGRDETGWSQQAYLKASNTGPFDWFGWSVAVSGDTVVVGALQEDSGANGVNGNQFVNGAPWAGAAYVFVRDGTTWSQQAYLKASNSNPIDRFGSSVAVWGDTVVVGAEGESSAATGVNGDQFDNSAVSAGAAYVFVRDGANWSQQAYLKASNTDQADLFSRVAVMGDTVVVGAYGEDSSATGVDGDQNDNSASGAGAAYVFVRDGTDWSQQAYLKASNADAGDSMGVLLSLSGDTLIASAFGEDSRATGVNGDQLDNSASGAGAAYVFVRSGTTWSQQAYLKASNTEAGDAFGAVGLWGDRVVVGATREGSGSAGVNGDQTDNSAERAGAAYVFERSGTNWVQQAYLKASNPDAMDSFGTGVAVSGDTVVINAHFEDSSATGVDGDQADNSAEDAGALYVFDLSEAECFLVVGDGPGQAPFFEVGHLFETQLDVVEDSFPVLLEDIPEFVLPVPTRRVRGSHQVSGISAHGAPGGGTAGDPPVWMLDGDFAVQILMWNPEVFPGQPEQFTAGLYVSIQPDGTVLTTPYGDDVGGLQIWHELDTNAAGQSVIRFPFSIPGFGR